MLVILRVLRSVFGSQIFLRKIVSSSATSLSTSVSAIAHRRAAIPSIHSGESAIGATVHLATGAQRRPLALSVHENRTWLGTRRPVEQLSHL